jgi:hypothetical protein
MTKTNSIPDPYAEGIAELRAAEAPLTPFEQSWAERAASDLVTTRKALDAAGPIEFKVLSEDDREHYRAPNPYEAALQRARKEA